MKYFLIVLGIFIVVYDAAADIQVFHSDGTYKKKDSLSSVVTDPSTAGKTIVISSALNAAMSNISSSTIHSWPSDRKLKIEKGGSIGNTTKFHINGPFEAGTYQVFTGTGFVSFGAGSVREIMPEWGGSVGGGSVGAYVYNVGAFPGDDLGAKINAAFAYGTKRNQGSSYSIILLVPPNPKASFWKWSTPVDLSSYVVSNNSPGFVTLRAIGPILVKAGANLDHLISVGVSGKTDRVEIRDFDFSPSIYTIQRAILIGGGTHYNIRDIHFQKDPRVDGNGHFVNGIEINRSLDPTLSGISYSTFENIHDTGGSACSNAMMKISGMVGCKINGMRVGNKTTYGIDFDTNNGNIQYNEISHILTESGSNTTSACVRITANDGGGFLFNTIRDLFGGRLTPRGIIQSYVKGTGIIGNNFMVGRESFSVEPFNTGVELYGGARNIYNGWGYNNGNPASTGVWNKFGYEGLQLIDVTNNTKHAYLTGIWQQISGESISSDVGDANKLLVVGQTETIVRFSTKLTTNRTATLSTNGAYNGAKFRIVRTGLGVGSLKVGDLITIPAATAAWIEVQYLLNQGWIMTGFGTF